MYSRIIWITAICFPFVVFAQNTRIETSDIDNFWIAYDSIRSTPVKEKQLEFLNKYYILKGSDGLKAFLKNKENADAKWLELINKGTYFGETIRRKTLSVKTFAGNLNDNILRLKSIYPGLKDAGTYFIIGFGQQGGLIRNNLSIIGSEVICAQPDIENEIQRITIHEYVHTQQSKPDFRNIDVLTSCLREGACDFISELVLDTRLNVPYIAYGEKNEVSIWKIFTQDMFTKFNDYWVSTGNNPVLPEKDLGYYVGYEICKSYYDNASDKKAAVKDIIGLDYSNPEKVTGFLEKSKYESYMIRKGFNKSVKIKPEGLEIRNNEVAFSFDTSKDFAITDSGSIVRYDPEKFGKIEAISIVGDFNKWDTKDNKFQLTDKRKNGSFHLKIRKDRLGTAGTKCQFRFLINGKYWVVPKFDISNRMINENNDINLYIQL